MPLQLVIRCPTWSLDPQTTRPARNNDLVSGTNSSNKHQEFSSHQLLKRAKNPPTGHAGIEVAPGLTPSFQTRSGW